MVINEITLSISLDNIIMETKFEFRFIDVSIFRNENDQKRLSSMQMIFRSSETLLMSREHTSCFNNYSGCVCYLY